MPSSFPGYISKSTCREVTPHLDLMGEDTCLDHQSRVATPGQVPATGWCRFLARLLRQLVAKDGRDEKLHLSWGTTPKRRVDGFRIPQYGHGSYAKLRQKSSFLKRCFRPSLSFHDLPHVLPSW